MSGFFRPEAMAVLGRWREVGMATAVILIGVWIALRPGGVIVTGFGYVLIALGTAFMVPALRRARFFAGKDGPGAVQVDEGRILYMGPVTGGTMALDDVRVLSVRRDGDDQVTWVLADEAQLLVIPVDAAGADALFDAFAALPGLNVERLIRAVQSRTKGSQKVWSRERPVALTP
ncbi:hypothetical protein [Gymnodinialimonas ulvae]|uniref:hypothetical protein n=1 Tax=Gymnodinialimonas ulvae TaxID=3126504 RepID=UPI0030ADC057